MQYNINTSYTENVILFNTGTAVASKAFCVDVCMEITFDFSSYKDNKINAFLWFMTLILKVNCLLQIIYCKLPI